MVDTVRIGILGTGFGVRAMVPGFHFTPGAEVVAICSGRLARAEAASREHNIPHAFDDYRAMLDQVEMDMVAIVTPVSLHHPMTLAALEHGCHVLCEKPMALNLGEALEMYQRAQAVGVVHMIDHELRFNPTRRRLGELLAQGYLGRVYHVNLQAFVDARADPQQPWGWWFSKAQGGGGLGAAGSHHVDLLRWWLGELVAVDGRVDTLIKQRPDPQTGEPRVVDADDYYFFQGELASGARVTVEASYICRPNKGTRIEIYGEKGSLILDADDRLWGMQAGDTQPAELTVPDPLLDTPGVSTNVWSRSFIYQAREMVNAIREGRGVGWGATFRDGAQTQAVLDAVRQSSDERRWVEVKTLA
ncbi:MAG: Gfo/Idh/MocA family oxidoreductase [Anaerolineae bacterium]|nr:Gfo/Idh/MocA family oxidoreductase [Anaerolineae bacterium]